MRMNSNKNEVYSVPTPIRVLQITGLGVTGISNVVMNYYRKINTEKVQFDFVTESASSQEYDTEVIQRGG